MTQPFTEGAAEGGAGNWGEVVTRLPYRKVRLDHLLSKEEQVKNGFHCLVIKERQKRQRHKKQKTKDAADFTVSKTG